MFRVESRSKVRLISYLRMSRKMFVLGGATVVLLFAGTFGSRQVAFSQQPQNSDIEVRSKQILAHLNLVIQFYRTTKQPIQKAGEPNDVVYRDQATELSSQVAEFAFQSAKAQAALMPSYQGPNGSLANAQATGEQQRLQASETNVETQIIDLNAREAALNQQIAAAKPRDLAALQAQKKQLQGALDLANAMKDALQKIVGMAGAAGGSGLAGDIERLQSSVPELQSKNKTVSALLTTIDSARSSGVTSQAAVLIDLLETRHDLDLLLKEEEHPAQAGAQFANALSDFPKEPDPAGATAFATGRECRAD